MLAAHQYLCETVHILHRDISIGNILLYRANGDQEAHGLLNDFDFSASFDPEKEEASERDPGPKGNIDEAHNSLQSKFNEDCVSDVAADEVEIEAIEDRVWTVSANPR